MKSIRRRLTRELLGVSLVLLGGGWIAFFLSARAELIEQFDITLRARALTLTALTVREGGRLRIEAADRLAREYGSARPRDFFEIWQDPGTPALRSDSLGGADLVPPGGLPDRHAAWDVDLPRGRPGRAISVNFKPRPIGNDRGQAAGGEVMLVVAGDRDGLDEALDELLGIAAIGGILLLAAILIGVPRVLRRGLRPLDRMAEQVSGIRADSLAARLSVADLPTELLPIADRLNDLLARLESSFDRERRFSADLAHELRTPIAEIRSLAECALKWPEARDPSTDRDVLASALHMESMVAQLLALARGEQRQMSAQRIEFRLDALVLATWEPFLSRAAERGLTPHFEMPPAPVAADPLLVRSILRNLFDNAVDYSPAGGEIRASIDFPGGATRLRISNPVETLDAGDVAQLFDRFWRKEAARSGQQHLGLGLPLARTFAEAMGWSLAAALEPHPLRLVFTLANSR